MKKTTLKDVLVDVRNEVASLDNPRDATFFDKLLKDTLSVEKFKNTEFSALESHRIKNYLSLMRYGQGSFSPAICKADLCPFNKACPLYSLEKAPHGESCPIEMSCLISSWQKWSDVVSSRGSDPGDPLYTHYINQLTYIDLLIQRTRWSQACEFQSPVVETVTKVGRGGEVAKEIVENPTFGAVEKLYKMQAAILENMTVSPKEEYKRKAALKQKDESDLAMSMYKKRSALKEKLVKEDTLVELPEHLD